MNTHGDTAAFFRIQCDTVALRRFRIRYALDADVRNCHVDIATVRSRPPLAAAQLAAFTGAGLPKQLALLIGVEAVYYAGFLSDHQRALTLARSDLGGWPKSKSGPAVSGLRAVHLLRHRAAVVEGSFSVSCFDHGSLPVSSCTARMASLVSVGGSE